MLERNIFQELNNIKENQPVFAGDLINKESAHELLKRKWALTYEGKYCMTELGKKILAADYLRKQSILI